MKTADNMNTNEEAKLAVLEVKFDSHILEYAKDTKSFQDEYRKDFDSFQKKQDYHHATNREIHTEINLLSYRIDNMDAALENNTKVCENINKALNTVNSLVQQILIERKTTKSNISVLTKSILWIGAFPALCYSFYQAIQNLIK